MCGLKNEQYEGYLIADAKCIGKDGLAALSSELEAKIKHLVAGKSHAVINKLLAGISAQVPQDVLGHIRQRDQYMNPFSVEKLSQEYINLVTKTIALHRQLLTLKSIMTISSILKKPQASAG